MNPVVPAVEAFLAIYNNLPVAIHALFNLSLVTLALFALLSLIWRVR